jgi:hypothetical protein
MPKKSQVVKSKKTSVIKKKPVVKTKTAAPKKKIIKKTVSKKTVKPLTKKANQIVVDIISDDNDAKELMPDFSSWSDFKKENDFNNETEDNNLITDEEIAPEENNEEIATTDDYSDNDDYDKQKKFFSDWAQQINPQDSEEKPVITPKKSVGLYRRQAFFYLGATLILLLAVAYFFLVKLTVVISPQGEPIKDYISFNVSDDVLATSTEVNTVNQSIDGELKIIEVEAEKKYQISAEEVVGDYSGSEVTGKVTLINNYTKAQPLVATTRLLSSDGKLFRLTNAVNIPAGGTLVADVYADKASPEMEIDTPTKFTIPGLWAGLQKDIYAENTEPLIYQAKVKRIVKQSDLDRAQKDISEVLDLKVANDLKAITTDKIAVSKSLDGELITEFDAKLGEEKSEFTVKAKKKIVAAIFSRDKVAEIAKTKISMIISDDKQLSDFNNNQITYDLEEYNPENKIASVRASFVGTISLKSDASLIDSKKLAGLNEEQIGVYLKSFPEIKDYKLEFWPTFIRTAPNLPDRINLKIAE